MEFTERHSDRRAREMAGYDGYARVVHEAVENFRERVCNGKTTPSN